MNQIIKDGLVKFIVVGLVVSFLAKVGMGNQFNLGDLALWELGPLMIVIIFYAFKWAAEKEPSYIKHSSGVYVAGQPVENEFETTIPTLNLRMEHITVSSEVRKFPVIEPVDWKIYFILKNGLEFKQTFKTRKALVKFYHEARLRHEVTLFRFYNRQGKEFKLTGKEKEKPEEKKEILVI